ncbi:tRNA pseudouridine(55) synthase TruB [bacterium]|nr:tRNA pseudouridine(55) synthase TruB [bacterium]
MPNGFINLYKESGVSSNKALSIVKRLLKENNMVAKVGHFGTLDPLAEGVLPIAIGRATRLFDYTLSKQKTYVATFLFGQETDTLDITGKLIKEDDAIINESDIITALPNFVGTIEQMPPQFSAKSINGVRAYKLARQGIVVDLQPKTITIFDIKLLKKVAHNTFEFLITCSGGTYIRSFVRDLAFAMGTVGVMTKLIRTKSGTFDIDSAIRAQEITDIENLIIPIESFTDSFEKIFLTEEQRISLVNGIFPKIDGLKDTYYAVYGEDKLMGIGERCDNDLLRLKTWLL